MRVAWSLEIAVPSAKGRDRWKLDRFYKTHRMAEAVRDTVFKGQDSRIRKWVVA